jgi:uncharacterized protein YkwD
MRYLAALRVGVRITGPSFQMTRVRRNASASLAAIALVAAVACVVAAPRTAGAHRTAHAAGAEGAGNAMATRSARGFARALLRRQNAERRRHGLRPLRASGALGRAARRHVRDMVRRHYFGHVSRGGHDVVDRVSGTSYGRGARFAVQENLYWWSRHRSPAAVLTAWMGSSVHRANILHPGFRQVGVATVMRSPYGRRGVTVVAVYGSRSAR